MERVGVMRKAFAHSLEAVRRQHRWHRFEVAFAGRLHGQAGKWYRLAAEQGDAAAQTNLGVIYDKGQGVPQDDAKAHMWFNLAAAQGAVGAARYRDVAAGRLTPDQIVEAQKLASEWIAAHPKP